MAGTAKKNTGDCGEEKTAVYSYAGHGKYDGSASA